MKKIINLFIIFFTFFILNNSIYASCSKCKIKDETAPVLDEYINNLRIVINNLSNSLNNLEEEKGIKKDISAIRSKILQTFNKIIDWRGYYSYFEFYIIYGIKNEYVPEVWRDYNILEKESAGIEKYLKYILNRGLSNIYITQEQACKGLENCDFSGTLADVIGQINNNHEKIKDYYRLSIVGKKQLFNGELKLVPNNFLNEFSQYYNEFTSGNCSKCDGNFSDRMQKAIENISNWQELGKDGIKSWKEAIAMLDGSLSDREMGYLERDLLEKELQRNGISPKASDTVLNNLKKYNETGGFSLDNNFITNSFDYVKNSIKSQIVEFRDSILQNFKNSGKKEVLNIELTQTKNELNTTKVIEERIKELYKKELPSRQEIDKSTENLQARMIFMHFNIVKAIENLDKTIPVSQKVCNDQATSKGGMCENN